MENSKNNLAIISVIEVSPDTIQSLLVVLAEGKSHFEVWVDKQEVDGMKEVIPSKSFLTEAEAKIYFKILTKQLSEGHDAD